jgi:hypothetical protein
MINVKHNGQTAALRILTTHNQPAPKAPSSGALFAVKIKRLVYAHGMDWDMSPEPGVVKVVSHHDAIRMAAAKRAAKARALREALARDFEYKVDIEDEDFVDTVADQTFVTGPREVEFFDGAGWPVVV